MSTLIDQLRQQVAENPYEYQNWENLLREVGKGPRSEEQIVALREVYENIVAIFPTTCAYWKDYYLWKMYVGYIRSLNADREDSPEGIMEVKTCLEFALEQVGQDVRAGELWQEYFDLLQSVQEDSPAYEKVFGEAVEGQADAAKTAALRRGMHKALNIPTTSLDAIWSMYEQFENSLGNKTLSKRSLDEWRPKYHASKAVSNERWSLVESLDTKMLPLPPGKGGHHQLEEAQKWRKYCHWESDNPGEADRPTHQARICSGV
eukprot:jgi/Picre1/35896/NNA_003354.t1